MSDQLPWDRFPTPAPEPELPYIPPDAIKPVPEPPAPVIPPEPAPVLPPRPPAGPRPSEIDWREILDQAWPAIREQAVDYARDTVGEIAKGHTVDLTHPTITAADMTGRELVIADAKSRSWRTLVQGLIFDVFAGIVAAVAMLAGLDPFQRETWIAFGVLLLKSVVSAVISYFMRLRITPTIKTPGEKLAVMPVPRPMIEENAP
jgi:hypothetical protein